MPTTRDDIRRWLQEGQRRGASHVVVLTDTFDYEDFPLYVLRGQDPHKQVEAYRGTFGDAYRVMECYNLTLDLDAQLAEYRANHWEVVPA